MNLTPAGVKVVTDYRELYHDLVCNGCGLRVALPRDEDWPDVVRCSEDGGVLVPYVGSLVR